MKEIGARIREIRKGKGLTMRQTAQQAGLAVSTLANIESGRHALSLPNLVKVAEALGVPPATVLPDPFDVAQQKVVPRNRLRYAYEGVEAELLTRPADPMGLSIFLLRFTRATETPPAAAHRGWEYLYVIEGVLDGMLADRLVHLEAGDFVSFQADKTHRFRSRGRARALMVAFGTGWLPGLR